MCVLLIEEHSHAGGTNPRCSLVAQRMTVVSREIRRFSSAVVNEFEAANAAYVKDFDNGDLGSYRPSLALPRNWCSLVLYQ